MVVCSWTVWWLAKQRLLDIWAAAVAYALTYQTSSSAQLLIAGLLHLYVDPTIFTPKNSTHCNDFFISTLVNSTIFACTQQMNIRWLVKAVMQGNVDMRLHPQPSAVPRGSVWVIITVSNPAAPWLKSPTEHVPFLCLLFLAYLQAQHKHTRLTALYDNDNEREFIQRVHTHTHTPV